MNNFDPGEGWREIPGSQIVLNDDVLTFATENTRRRWVREEPVPPLPTEPRTSIEVTYIASQQEERERTAEDWVLLNNGLQWMSDECEFRTADELCAWITGFEVLAEPHKSKLEQSWYEAHDLAAEVRRETARAVLAMFREALDQAGENPDHEMFALEDIAREFGVES